MFKNAFANLQKVGKSLMLPVSVLPIAGILLGVGSANFSWLPAVVSHVMAVQVPTLVKPCEIEGLSLQKLRESLFLEYKESPLY